MKHRWAFILSGFVVGFVVIVIVRTRGRDGDVADQVEAQAQSQGQQGQQGPPSIDAALEGLRIADRAAIPITIATSDGPIHCTLDATSSPRAASMFLSLARKGYFNGQHVFRAIADLMIQSGCPNNDGTGHPGYRIELETSPNDKERLSRSGALLLASYNPPPNRIDPSPPPPGHVIGSQWVIALGDMSHLAGTVTVIGACRDLDVVSKIANAVAAKARTVIVERISP